MNPELPPAPPEQQWNPDPSKSTSFWIKNRWIALVAIMVMVLATIAALFIALRLSTVVQSATATKTSSRVKTTTATPTETTWVAAVDPAKLPLGDGKVSTSPQVGYINSCNTSFRGGGAQHSGSWIDSSNNTWNSTTKVAVSGSVDWPTARYTNDIQGQTRVISTDDLPVNDPTGIFPIKRTDPAYQYDTNPNHIANQSIAFNLPVTPTAASTPHCVSLGYIGILTNGVLLFNALDDAGRDAVAHETQDLCNGHPDGQERYHYHNIASCIRNRASGSATLVGYALDGYGIYVERDSKGQLPTNADLDVCHGRTSDIQWDGVLATMYHYDATLEYPYTVGCYHGTPISTHP